MTIKAKKSKINLREKLAELLNFRQIRDRLDGLGLYLGKDRTGTAENLAVRGGASIDDLQLAEISAALGGTAVDVFVYDTRNDSDGGKWRERTQHTSWYNEELNTTTRGGRREFPAVAVIVAEASKVTIYDGDDPDLSMWMVFNASGGRMIWATQLSCVSSLNARLSIGSPASGFRYIDFVSDKNREWRTSGVNSVSGDISERNSGNLTLIDIPGQDVIVNQIIRDVAMTVLPNATIDSDTGLPIPTIAVATDGGVSVIKDDGLVESDSSVYDRSNITTIGLTENRIYGTSAAGANLEDAVFFSQPITLPFPEGVDTRYPFFVSSDAALQFGSLMDENSEKHIISNDGRAIGGNLALGLLDEQAQNPTTGMLCAVSSSYNTGWMPGDIKLAALSDTKIETVGVDESNSVINNGEDWTGVEDSTTEPTGWTLETAGSANYAVASGELTINQTGIISAKIYQSFDVVEGKVYNLEVRYKANSGTARYQVADNAFGVGSAIALVDITTTSYVTERKTFIAQTTGKYSIAISCYGGGASATFDYVTIKQTGELITNGTFDDGTEGWEQGNTASIGWDSSNECIQLQFSTGDWNASYQAISTEVGKKYTVSGEIISNPGIATIHAFTSNSDSGINWPDSLAGSGNFSSTTGNASFSFVATGSITYIYLLIHTSGGTSSYYKFDNISVRLAEDDRSVNDNGLQVFGEIDKTPVAPGADLVAYSGFSANNYLMQPYNPDLDFGTGDFCIMGWFKGTSTNGTILDRANSGATLGRVTLTFSTYLEFKTIFNGATITCASNKSISDNTWHYFSAVRRDGKLSIYIDGFLSSSEEDSNHDLSNPDAYLNVGLRYNLAGSLGSGDNLALLRASATAPTDEQIAKIYRDEKALFTDGAGATLHGTSDAVTALAYDDKTELLHVGTSDGRSDFSGLRRINNTTTAVTTSISASNNLIAEQ